MNNKTQTYFTTLLVSLALFGLIKIGLYYFNKPKIVSYTKIDKKEEIILIKKTEPVTPKENKHQVTKNGLISGGNWHSR